MSEINIGQYSIPVILTIMLGIVYNIMGESLSNRAKPLIAIGIGMLLGFIAMARNEVAFTVPFVIDYVLYGFMSGAAAVGLYEAQKAVRKS